MDDKIWQRWNEWIRDERKYQALPNLKAVAKFGVGVDNIDGELAKKYGVKALMHLDRIPMQLQS